MRSDWVIPLAIMGVIASRCVSIRAAPPEGADSGLEPWFKSLRRPGTDQPCCSVADCRRVLYRVHDDHFQVFIGRDFPRWTNPPFDWVDVPEANVLRRQDNPTGEGVACWFGGSVLCFIPAAGT